jgi:hypothetical protein
VQFYIRSAVLVSGKRDDKEGETKGEKVGGRKRKEQRHKSVRHTRGE